MKKILFVICPLIFIVALTSCEKDPVCENTYDDIKSIINTSCAYSGCHSGGTDAGSGIPDIAKNFTTYAGMKASLDNGLFAARALNDRDMPPSFAPMDKPMELTDAQIESLTCWKDNGYAE